MDGSDDSDGLDGLDPCCVFQSVGEGEDGADHGDLADIGGAWNACPTSDVPLDQERGGSVPWTYIGYHWSDCR